MITSHFKLLPSAIKIKHCSLALYFCSLVFPILVLADNNVSCDQSVEFPFNLSRQELIVPYPNNIFTRKADTLTGIKLNVDKHTPVFKPIYSLFSHWLNSYNKLDGFGVYNEVFIPKPRNGVPKSLTLSESRSVDAGVFLMVADPNHRFYGEIAPTRINIDKNHIRLTPLVPLLENTRYMAVVTQQLETVDNHCLSPSETLNALIQDDGIEESWGLNYQGTLQTLKDNGVDTNDILSIAEFHTLSVTPDMEQVKAIMDDLIRAEEPRFSNWEIEWNKEGDIASDVEADAEDDVEAHVSKDVAGYVHATLNTPIFRNIWGVWEKDSEHHLRVRGYEDVNVMISLPDSENIEYQQPYPLVIFAHGTTSSREVIRDSKAQVLAEAGFAGISMDSFCWGDRTLPNADEITKTLCYYNFMAPLAWRDNGRESAAGYMWLKRAIKSLENVDVIPEGGDGIPDFDTNNLYFMGVSLGAMQGGIFTGVEPDIKARILGVSGAKYSEIAYEHSIVKTIHLFTNFIDRTNKSSDLTHLTYLVGSVFQSILDASDPGVYIYYQHKYQELWMDTLQIGGAYDNTVSGASGAVLARAGGWPQMVPYVLDAGTDQKVEAPFWGSGFFQYDTYDHDFIFSEKNPLPVVKDQIRHFLRTSIEFGQTELVWSLPE